MAKISYKFLIIFLAPVVFLNYYSYPQPNLNDDEEAKITDLISKMTIDEKIGQLVQLVGGWKANKDYIRAGKIGSYLLGAGDSALQKANELQKIAVEETRLGIPLLFANDIIHGYHTIFPIPLAEASSWNPDLVKEACGIAAFEAAANGTHWTYAPMVDIARDPRWGRIMEGSGEDPFLGSVFAKVRVEGFQGNDIRDKTKIAACAKHYVAYGEAEAGKDYNTVDISERTLREIFLPPFHAAVNSGAASIMSAFNDLNGVPTSGNHFTLTEILRNEWQWDGVVISDYNSIGELIKHRFAADKKEAALKGLTAGVDIDMVGDSSDGNAYSPHLADLLSEGSITEELIDKSVRNVLRMKFRLGLFEAPYTDSEFYKENNLTKEYKDSIALQLARESIVLLKNESNILPLKKSLKKIALIGPLANVKRELHGMWAGGGRDTNVVTVLQGLKNNLPKNIEINYVQGCGFNDSDRTRLDEAVETALNSDVAILVVGESRGMSGEAASRSSLNIPGVQEELIKKIYETGTPVVVVLMNGRPLTINWVSENIPAIVEAWYLGDQAGNAIAQVLFGDYNPSGKLPITFPRSVGQIPLYYNHKSTGRPKIESDKYTSKYIDSPNRPLYPFSFGLSYTTFAYDNLNITPQSASTSETIDVSVDVSNTGSIAGEEVVQLYIMDEVASVTLPVKQLKGFKKIKLNPGETSKVEFTITPDMLSFYGLEMKKIIEPGKFQVMIGGDSEKVMSKTFELISN